MWSGAPSFAQQRVGERKNTMAVELECKVRVESHEVIRERLRGAGATYVGRVCETNRLFDDRDGSLLAADSGLRVRSIRVLDGQGPSASLTYKGPRQAGDLKRREETESAVSDAEAVAAILGELGFGERVLFEKRRESWRLAACQVELDELPALGLFVEVEGPTAAVVKAAIAQLGLADEPLIVESYIGLLFARSDESGSGDQAFRFE